MLSYSRRFRRGIVTDPGLRYSLQSRLLMASSIQLIRRRRSSIAGCGPAGGISFSRRTRKARTQIGRARMTA